MTILDQLADHAKERVALAKERLPYEAVKERALALPKGSGAFYAALRKEGLGFICECKKASPSKGLIAEDFPYLRIAREYEEAGAECISVLTEPKWFLGKDAYLREITDAVHIPCIRKDFTVDPYMIYEAALLGAQAVLLICAILDDREIAEGLEICERLGIDALCEAHDEAEVRRLLALDARIIGVNNRNLKDFSVDVDNSRRLRELIPPEHIFVSESGIRDARDVAQVAEMGADALLVGEALMRKPDKTKALRELKELL